jgi:hypothetical protein
MIKEVVNLSKYLPPSYSRTWTNKQQWREMQLLLTGRGWMHTFMYYFREVVVIESMRTYRKGTVFSRF